MQLAQKIIVADDHPLFRTALQQAVSQIAPDAEIVQAESLPELQTVVEGHADTDLILLDLNMPGAHGYSGLVFLRSHYRVRPTLSQDRQPVRSSVCSLRWWIIPA